MDTDDHGVPDVEAPSPEPGAQFATPDSSDTDHSSGDDDVTRAPETDDRDASDVDGEAFRGRRGTLVSTPPGKGDAQRPVASVPSSLLSSVAVAATALAFIVAAILCVVPRDIPWQHAMSHAVPIVTQLLVVMAIGGLLALFVGGVMRAVMPRQKDKTV